MITDERNKKYIRQYTLESLPEVNMDSNGYDPQQDQEWPSAGMSMLNIKLQN